jgi:hypothetical protein
VPKRWVVVRPPDAETGILLARAEGEHQEAIVGNLPRAFSSCANRARKLRQGRSVSRHCGQPLGSGRITVVFILLPEPSLRFLQTPAQIVDSGVFHPTCS